MHSLDPKDEQQLDREVINFRRQTYAPTTKSTYMSQTRSYLSFCAYYGYQPLPAAGSTLNRYAAFLARSLSESSIPAYLNAARILHLEHGLTDPTKNKFHLATTLREIRRAKGLKVSQKKTITPQTPLALKNQLNRDDPWHATLLAEGALVPVLLRITHWPKSGLPVSPLGLFPPWANASLPILTRT